METAIPHTRFDSAKWLLAAAFALYAVARLWHAGAVALDGDEIFSLSLARQSWRGLFDGAVFDAVHPPLFYVLLKVWRSAAGEGLTALRGLPVLLSLAALPPLVGLCRLYALSRRESAALVAVAALNPYLIFYAQHLRMYSLLFAASLWSVWALERFLADPRSGRSLAVFTVANTVVLYAQYFGALLIGFECVYVLLWHRRAVKAVWSSAVVSALVFVPWLATAAAAARRKGGLGVNLDWIPQPGLDDLVWFYVDATGSAGLWAWGVVPPLVALAAIVLWAWRCPEQPARMRLQTLLAVGPPLLLFAICQVTPHSVWGHRHLLISAIPVLLLACVAASRAAGRTGRVVFGLSAAAWALLTAGGLWRGDDQKVAWDRLTLELSQAASKEATVYVLDAHLHYPLTFYLEEIAAGRSEHFSLRLPQVEKKDIRVTKASRFPSLVPHFWVAYNRGAWGETDFRRGMGGRPCRETRRLSASSRYQTVELVEVECTSLNAAPSARGH